MKENKTVQIKFRLTESQKKQVEEYAVAQNMNVSEVMRLALNELLNKKEKYDGIAIIKAINEATIEAYKKI